MNTEYPWGEPSYDIDVTYFGRLVAIASYIDDVGMAAFFRMGAIRDNVNPWRHVATRQKHFHHASGHVKAFRIQWAFDEDDGSWERLYELSQACDEAHNNCRWGV